MNFQVNNGEERNDRWKNAYFARYQSPNITIVPTVFFCHPPPRTEPIADPNTNSPTSPRLNCEQLTPVKDNIGEPSASPSRPNCDQQNLQRTSSNTSTSIEFSDKFRNSLCVIQDTISTEAPAFNMSQNIQDLSTCKYKSRNNLVDLTGFNLLKRERHSTSSLPKRKDLRQMDDTIEHDNMKTRHDENDHRNYSISDGYKTDNISKESSTSEKPPSTHSEGNTENLANGEPKENKTDMEVKMKKYFRQLWKRKFDKLKDKAAKEKHSRAIKSSSKTRQDCKDSKQESSCSKANLQKVSKSYPTKDLKNKIIDSSIKYRNLERRFMGNYPERSKCEINSRHLPDSKVCIRDLKIDLSPDSIKRYKDFQHFRRHNNDHEIKYKNENQIKTENLPRKIIRLKSCETTTNKPVIKKKVDERKQSIKIEKRNKINNNQTNLERVENYTDMERTIDQSNTNRVKLIKSVVRVDKNVQNSLSQSKRDRSRTPPGEQDLRSRLSRKRAKSEYFVNCHEPMENRLDQESLMITVKQDVKGDSKNSPILAPTVNKPKPKKCKQESIMITVKQDVKADSKNSPILAPTVNKPKKCKRIKLTINIECPNSDNSDQDFKECCSSPEDLRFLDDFNIDEIVDSLNNSQVEPNKTIKADNYYKNNEQIKPKTGLINNTSMKVIEMTKKEETTDNDYKNNEQIKPKTGLINNTSMKAIEMTKKEETTANGYQNNEQIKPKTDLINNASMKAIEMTKKEETTDNDYKNNEQIKPKKGLINNASMKAIEMAKKEETTDNDYKNNEQIKPEKGLINNASIKAIEITKKEETSAFIGQVIEINSDTEDDDMNIEIGSVANTKKCKYEQNVENSKVDRNTKQEANNITDLTGNGYEENAPKEIIDLCKDEQEIKMSSKVDRNTKQEANNITDLTGNGYEEKAPKEITDLCKDEKKNKMNSKFDRNTKQEANNKTDLNGKYCDKNEPKETINLSDDNNYSVVEVIDITDENEQYMTSKHLQPKKTIQTSNLAKKVNKPSVIRRTGLENANKKSHNTQHEDKTPRITVKQKSDPINITKKKQSQLYKSEDPIEASLQIMFNIEQNTSVNSVGVKRDVIKKLNTLDKHVKENNDNSHHSEDTVEASLEAMFNNYEQNGSIRKHIKQNKINGCDRKAKENLIQNSVVEVSLESIFNGTKHQDTGINMDIEQPSLSGQHIRKEIDVLQTAQLMKKLPLEITNNEDKIPRITVKQKSDPTSITKTKQSQFQKSEDPIEASLQKMFNIEQNKSVNSIGFKSDVIKQLNTLDKHVKEKNDNSHHSEDTVEASLEAMFNNYEQNCSIRKHIEQNKINGCDREAKENSIQNGNSDIEQPSLSGQHIRKDSDVLQPAPVTIKVPLETTNNKVDQKKNLNDIKTELSNKHITDKHIIRVESESQQPINPILPETTKNGIEMNAEIKFNSKPLNVSDIIENRSQKSGSISKESLETEENILEKATNTKDIIALCSSSKNVKKKLQTFEDTVNTHRDKPINNIEKKTNNVISSPPSKHQLLFDSGNSTNGTLETAKSFAENCLTSPQIDIRPQNSIGQNNKPKDEPLHKSVETIKTSSKATIDNGEQKTNIKSESNKSVEEKALLPLENSVAKSEKSPERSNVQHKTNATTSVELTIPDKNIDVTSQKTSISKAEKSLMANNKESTLTSKKSNVENQTKSETVKNNTQKLETIVDASSDLNNATIKDSELGKRSEIATNTKTKQEQVVSNKSLVPDGSKNKDEKISNKKAEIFTTGMKRFLSNLESRMSEYLQKKFIFSSIIHNGRFSTIYKCSGTKGDTYAVKVVRQRQMGKFMEGMLFYLQQYRSRQDSFVLYLMSAFEVQNRWCLQTEYYPKNLKQALHGCTNGFHIDQVQVLSRQLVDAVNMLTNAGVIHSDIKPTHILLNSAHNRLKLCGFDRSNYSTCINILLSNGTLIYRAPEVILGFQEVHGIDVWSTALVMFEMATNKTLLMGGSNNEILYQQLCTFGNIDWLMLEQSRFRELYFSGTSFIREFHYKNSEKIFVVQCMHKNEKLRRTLFQSYERQWARNRSKWQMTRDMDKLESLHTLLEQMLVLNPRNRLPIEFVCGSEFMIHRFT